MKLFSLLLIVVVLLFAGASCATIWALNTLFPLDIPYTFETIIATLILILLIDPVSSKTGK
jgi:hypothetical protein